VEIDAGAQIVWPGFITETPDDKVPLMTIALLYPGSLSNGKDYPYGADILKGFNFAVNEINTLGVISPYKLLTHAVDTKFSTVEA
jgi:hypothetical protein